MSLRRRVALAIVVAGTVAGTAVALAATGSSPSASSGPRLRGEAVWRPGSRPAPDFRLRDQHGRASSPATFRGRPFLLVFLDSKCRTLCPIVGRQLGDAERVLGSAPVQLVTISVDQGDSPASVRAAARHWGWRGHWSWLMGSHTRLSAAWKAYGITVRPTSADITHSLAVFLIDANGDQRAGFLPPLDVHDVVRDVRLLQGEAARHG